MHRGKWDVNEASYCKTEAKNTQTEVNPCLSKLALKVRKRFWFHVPTPAFSPSFFVEWWGGACMLRATCVRAEKGYGRLRKG